MFMLIPARLPSLVPAAATPRRWISISIGIAFCLLVLLLAGRAVAAEDQYASVELHLLNTEESAILTQQASLVAQSTAIKGLSKPEIQKLRIYLNSGMILANFPIDKSLQDAYLEEVSRHMSRNRHIQYVTKLADHPQGAILTTLSLVPISSEKSMVEVSIAAFDWNKATNLKEGMPGIIKSLVWVSIGRKIIPSPSDSQAPGTDPKLRLAYTDLVKSAFSAFLLAF